MMKPTVSIGTQNFETIRKNHDFYIDKTAFVKEWWESRDTVTLITRPRRFGKTLNMSMVEDFFSLQYAGREDLFEGLSIWQEEKYQQMQGSYPVIFLSFAGIKGSSYEAIRDGIVQVLINLYTKYRFLLEGDFLNEQEKEYFNFIKPDMSDAMAAMALHRLAICLERYYGKKTIILLDEYDTPLQEAYLNGFWDELIVFIRSLFNATFKTNPYLERGLLTGITRISKESIFSDMNNLEVITTTSEKYGTAFGFTEEEVIAALKLFGVSEKLERVRFWYNGFRFGNRKDIYNPWSITKYLDRGKFDTYWANTSSNHLVGKLIQRGTSEVKIAVEDLLAGKPIWTELSEEVVFEELEESDQALWSLLLASGYLRVEEVLEQEDDEEAEDRYALALTNLEVKKEFRRLIQKWFKNSSSRYNDFIKALLAEDIDYMNEYMNQVALQSFSSFDTGKKPSDREDPERFYHGFVLGLIVDLAGKYQITSNRESGFGRYDVMMEPVQKGDKAFILEFKVFHPARERDLVETVQNALKQIEEKQYDMELIKRGVTREAIRHYGFAFEGKRVLIG